jgi:hypothetical protein
VHGGNDDHIDALASVLSVVDVQDRISQQATSSGQERVLYCLNMV